jgi:hypothetical protein
MRSAFLLFLFGAMVPAALADDLTPASTILVGPWGSYRGSIGLPVPVVAAKLSKSNPSRDKGQIELGKIYLDGETDMLGPSFPIQKDRAPDNGLLIGLEIGTEAAADGESAVTAVLPIYRAAAGEVRGPKFGDRFRNAVVAKAKEGYAVGAILGRSTQRLEGFCVIFMKVKSDGDLDVNDTYQSEWFGKYEGAARLLGGTGAPVQGILSRLDRERKLTGFGLLLRPLRAGEATPAPTPNRFRRDPPRIADANFPVPEVERREEHANPSRSLDSLSVTRINNAGETEVVGSQDPIVKDRPTDEGLLIGFEVGTRRDDPIVLAATPIYMTTNGEERGKAYGNVFERRLIAKAKDGYAVGGLVLRCGGAIDGFYLIYMKVKTGATLDVNDSYQSEWIGNHGGGPPILLGCTGETVVGFQAAGRPGDRLSGLGLLMRKD